MGYRFLGDYEPQKGKKKNGAQTAPRSGNSANPFAVNQKKPSAQATGAAQAVQNVRTSRGTALGGSAVTPVQMLKPTAPKLTKATAAPIQKTTPMQPLKLPNIQAFGAGDYSRAGKTLDRAAKAVKAGALNSAAGFTEIAAQFHPTTGEQSMGQFSGFGDLGRAVRENREKGTDINGSIRQQEEQRRAQRKQSQQKMFVAADRLTEKGQQYEQEAKQGLGTVGQFLVDMGVTGTQMAGDAIANLVLPGSGLAMMGMRSYGQAAGEARKAGKSEQQQFLAGLKSAGIEVFTEKMFGAFSKVYGGAAADELIEKLVGKMTGNVTGQALLTWMINGVGEGVEEVTSDLLNPLADRLLGLDDGTGPIWSVDDLAQWGYDFLLGTAMGIVGGGTQLARGVQQGRAQTAESRYYDDLLRNGLGSAAAAENARRASAAMGRVMPARDGLRMPQLTTYEQRQAAETSRQRAATRYTAEEAAAKRKDARTFRNIIAGIDTSVSDFFERWKSGRKSHLGEKLEQLYIAPMPDNMAEEVSRIVGYHVDSRDFIVTSDDVKHVIDQHGNPAAEIAKGNIPLETWMLDALPDVVTNPDSIEPGNLGTGNKNAGKRGIVFSKAFPGGKIITIQFDNKGRGTLELNTMYAKESATLEGNGTDVPNTFTPEAAKPALSYAEKTRTSRYAMPSTQESAAPAINAQNGPPQSFSLKTSVPQAQESVNRLKMPQLVDEQGRTYEERVAWQQIPETQRAAFDDAQRIAQRFGARVVVSQQEGVNGSYRDGVISLNPYAVNPVRQTLIHELTHHMERSGLYGEFRDMALRYVAENMGADVDSVRQAVIADYARNGVALDEDGATREIVAKFAEEKLFTDETTVRRLLAEDRNLFQRIYDWIRDMAGRLTGTSEESFLRSAEKLYAKALRETTAETGRGTQMLFAGENARTANMQTLNRAQALEASGAAAEDIRRETGWFRGMDGKWRFEIDDSAMRYDRQGVTQNPDVQRKRQLEEKLLYGQLTQEETNELRALTEMTQGIPGPRTLSDYIQHDALFEAYPELRDAAVVFEETEPGVNGYYNAGQNTIVLDSKLRGAPESTLVHEIQHAVQRAEGFARGSTPEYWAARDYETGEIIQALEQEYNQVLRGLDSKTLNKYLRYQEVNRAMENLESAEEGTPAAEKYVQLDRISDQLYTELWDIPEFKRLLDLKRQIDTPREVYDRFYRNTAGEIEARDAAARRGYDAEQRRLRMPNLGNANTVFAGGNGTAYDINPFRRKAAQLSAIQQSNPFDPSLGAHTWIRSEGDILTYQEAIDNFGGVDDVTPDFRAQDVQVALDSGYVTVYSSYPIEQGTFVTPSRMEAQSYAGEGRVYSKQVPLSDVAWLDEVQGQYTGPVGQAQYSTGRSLDDFVHLSDEDIAWQEHRERVRAAKREARLRYLAEREEPHPRRGEGMSIKSEENRLAGIDPRLRRLSSSDWEALQSELEENGTLEVGGISFSYENLYGLGVITGIDRLGRTKESLGADGMEDVFRQIVYDASSSPLRATRQTEQQPQRNAAPINNQNGSTQVFSVNAKVPQTQAQTNGLRMPQLTDEQGRTYEERVAAQRAARVKNLEDNIDALHEAVDNGLRSPRLTTYEQRMAEQRAAEEAASVPANGPVTGPEKSYPSFDGQLMMPQVLRAEVEAEMAQRKAQNTERPAPTPEEAQAAREDADAISRATAMMDRDFAEADRQAREQQAQQEQTNREMPEALKKLGVEPFGSEADYAGIDNLAQEMRWNGSARKQTQRQMNKIPATEKERTFARRLADGTLDAADIPNTVNRETVETLADFYRTLDSAPETMLLRQRRAIIMEREEAKMGPLLGMDVAYDEGGLRTNGKGDRKNSGSIAKQTSTLRRNLQTPARICATEWGPEHGKKVYEALFYPVTENNGRQIDWVNSMLDRVRTFKDSKGEERPLNRKERELVQKIVEHEGSKDRVAAFDEQYKDAVENVRNGASAEDAAKMFGIDPSYQEYQDLQNYETYLKALEDLHDSKSADDMAVGKAVDAYSKLYKELYDGINSFLVAHGYQPIGFIEGYAPHMQPEAEKTAFSKALKLLGLDDTAMSLPTSISGKTADLKPYKQYNPFFQERHGVNTEYDIAKGFEEYVYYLGNIFYHTDDIMRIRTAEKYIRKTYSSEEASEQISRAESARDFSNDQIMDFLRMSGVIRKGTKLAPGDARVLLEDYIGRLYDQIGNITRYSEMAKYLDNYANRLAGKQNMADRGAEAATGRGSLNWINTLTGKYGGAKLAFNVSSALNQTSQIPMVAAENGERATLHAIGDFFKSKKDRAAFVQESNFLKGKKGIDWLLGPETGWEKFKEKGFTLIEMVDSFTSFVAVRSKYLKEIKAGKSHADAMKLADEYGRNVMGSRARGEKPMLFDTKNPFWQIVTRFQLEALNSWEHVSRDLPNEVRQMAREKGKAYAAGTMGVRVAKYLTYGFLLNLGIGALSGGSPVPYDVIGSVMEALGKSMGLSKLALVGKLVDNVLEAIFDKRLFGTDGDDDDDAEKDWWAFLESLWGDVANDIPVVGQLAALAGVGDETLPVTDLSKVGDFAKSVKNNGLLSMDTLDKGATAAGEFFYAGNQLRKTLQGGIAVAQGGVYSKGKLRYQVDQTPGNIAKGVLFGRSALNESQAYYAERTSDFSENQTKAFRQMQDRGVSAKASYDLLQELRSIEKTEESTEAERQRDALRQSSVSGAGKWVTYYQTMASEKEWKTMDAMQYNSEADYGTVTSLLMDMKEQDNDADKMRLIDRSKLTDSQKAFLYKRLVAGDEDLEKINALKDAGISDYQYFQYKIATSGLTKKEAKLHAINTLDLTDFQKDALYYMNSYASSKHWEAPWEQGVSAMGSDFMLTIMQLAETDDGEDTPKWQQSLNEYMDDAGRVPFPTFVGETKLTIGTVPFPKFKGIDAAEGYVPFPDFGV